MRVLAKASTLMGTLKCLTKDVYYRNIGYCIKCAKERDKEISK